jgi:hypothetical protein
LHAPAEHATVQVVSNWPQVAAQPPLGQPHDPLPQSEGVFGVPAGRGSGTPGLPTPTLLQAIITPNTSSAARTFRIQRDDSLAIA